MATDVRPPRETAKNDAFVAGQLQRAEQRIRSLDLATGLLGLLAGVLGYAALMALCDHRLDLGPRIRQLGLGVLVVAALVYAWLFLLLPLRRRVNPYYAAREVEKALPGARNSIVNWVDLHGQELPPAIHGVLGQRAARDLGRVDLDQAISGRNAGRAALVAALFAAAALALFLWLGRSELGYRLGRAFAPFGAAAPTATHTRLTIIRPEGGDALVTLGRAVRIEVRIEGDVPDAKAADAPKLQYRYQPSEEYRTRPLQRDEERWTITLPAGDVRNGFWYRVSAGDAETPEHRIRVRPAPKVVDFQAIYHFRPYVARADLIRGERKLEALRGTQVTLRVRTNRTLAEGRLERKNGEEALADVPGPHLADDPESFEVQMTLDASGSYRLHFRSQDGEAFTEKVWSPIVAIPDQVPRVELTVPGKDVQLPANGILRLEGKATDDVGVEKLTLRAEVVQGAKLRAKPFRGGSLRLPDGGSPRQVEYRDFVDLSEVRTEDGARVALPVGTTIRYWLEARDGCDYPKAGGQVAESKPYLVHIIAPEGQPQHQRDRQQAEQEQQKNEARQDEQMKKENDARQEERRQQEAQQQEAQQKRDEKRKQEQAQKEAGKEGQDKKDGESQAGKKQEGQKNDRNAGEGQGAEGQRDKQNAGQAGNDPRAEKPSGQGEAKGGENGGAGRREDKELEKKLSQLENQLSREQKPQPGKEGRGERKPGAEKSGQAGTEQSSGADKNTSGKPGAKPEGNAGTPRTEQNPGAKPESGGSEKRPMRSGAEQPAGTKKPGQPGAEQPAGTEKSGKPGSKPSEKPEGSAGTSRSEQNPGAKPEGTDTEKRPMSPGADQPAGTKKPGQPGAEQGTGKEKPATGAPSPKPGERSDSTRNGTAEKGPKSSPKEPAPGKPGSSEKEEKPGSKPAGPGEKRSEPKEPGSSPTQPMSGQGTEGTPKPTSVPKPGEPKEGTQNGSGKPAPRDPKEKNQGTGTSPSGEKRPEQKEPGSGNGEQKNPSGKLTDEQIEQLARRLDKLGNKERAELIRKQQQTRDQASDPVQRDNAQRLLEAMRRLQEKNNGGGKPGDQGSQAAPKEGSESGPNEKGRPGSSTSPKGDPSGKPGSRRPGEPGTPGDPNGSTPPEGQRPGNRADAPQNPQAEGNPGDEAPKKKPPQAGKPRPPRATMLQLEGLDALKRKQLLEKAGLTELDYRKLRKRYLSPTPATPENSSAPGAGVSLPSIGSQRKGSAGQGGDSGSASKGQPPPGYRNARLKFAKELEGGGQR